jgi:hypothetical protein
MKRCIACGAEKPLVDYYLHAAMVDGHSGRCKECQKANARAARAARLDYYQEYDRKRNALPHRVQAREVYDTTMRGQESIAAAQKSWIVKNPAKRAAHILTGNAIRDGRLIRQPCEVCDCVKVQAHHDDYNQPLAVRWLCQEHHVQWHKDERNQNRHPTSACYPSVA